MTVAPPPAGEGAASGGEAFRRELQAWLEAHKPAAALPEDFRERWAAMREWQRRLAAAGWVAVSYPEEYGGRGLGALEESILSEELARAGAPPILPLGHLGHPILTHGTEEQKRRYLPNLLAAEEIWCQGFSEPSAGSDLAGLRTKAVAVDGGYRISGQKMWTSYGVFADFALVLARTGDPADRHRGISAFLVDLSTPGVSVRPIVLANGDEEFAELFFDDVAVPAANLLGREGDGWTIAMEAIGHERGAVDTGYGVKFAGFVAELADEVHAAGRDDDPEARRALGRAVMLVDVLRLQSDRSVRERLEGRPPGPEASVDKLLMTTVEQNLMDTALELTADRVGGQYAKWFDRYLYGRAGSIYGGSAQIQRNILAQRVLALPKAP